ncbi:hypothetical protein GOD21_12845 [Sinorhizobium medicae]|nr:hypothetical protein [Sinorhizobium medicae]
MSGPLDYGTLSSLIGTRTQADCPCPVCGPGCRDPRNRRRKVLRLWHMSEDAISFRCVRCEAKGYAVDWQAKPVDEEERAAWRRKIARAHEDEARERRRKFKLAERLYAQARPVAGTLAVDYFRQYRAIKCPLPPSMRFLPPSRGYPAAVLMPFVDPACNAFHGLHMTRLDAAGRKLDKIMLGAGSAGYPLICAEPAGDHLVICEGVEDALTLTQVTGLPSWAAGSAGRLPALADRIPAWVNRVTISEDPDLAGKQGTAGLYRALRYKRLAVAVIHWDEEAAS